MNMTGAIFLVVFVIWLFRSCDKEYRGPDIEVFAAMIFGLVLLSAAIIIAVDAVRKLANP